MPNYDVKKVLELKNLSERRAYQINTASINETTGT